MNGDFIALYQITTTDIIITKITILVLFTADAVTVIILFNEPVD
jgi:hypothetical protein